MIQIYSPTNTNFDMNGDSVLLPTLCDLDAELGGTWTLEMEHPIDEEGKWAFIEKEAVLSAPTFMGKRQLFRISEVDKQDEEIIVKAYPIFFDSADEVFLMDKRPTKKNGQDTLDILTAGTKYKAVSDISKVSTAYFVRRNLMDVIGGDSPSFIEKWGGEPLYDNYTAIINERAGGDYGAEVRYGKNMNGISYKEDLSTVVTRIVPVAFNGHTLSTGYVDSPLINKYAKLYTREVRFEDVKHINDIMDDEDTSGIIVCNSQAELDAALIAKCNEQFQAGLDVYGVTIEVDLIALENTEEYRDFVDLVKIGLGDTVRCYNKRLGVSAEARAIHILWDCIRDTSKEVKLGDYEKNFLVELSSSVSKIEKTSNEDGTINADLLIGVIDGLRAQLKVQLTPTKRTQSRVILFEDIDPVSHLYGAVSIGTQGIQVANKRTADDKSWEWISVADSNGIAAGAILSGILTDKEQKTSWNIDTGELQIGCELLSTMQLQTEDQDGNKYRGLSGEFVLADGNILKVVNGIICEEMPEEVPDGD